MRSQVSMNVRAYVYGYPLVMLLLRMYSPSEQVLNNQYSPPAIQRASGPATSPTLDTVFPPRGRFTLPIGFGCPLTSTPILLLARTIGV
jgi:hypothetical protein